MQYLIYFVAVPCRYVQLSGPLGHVMYQVKATSAGPSHPGLRRDKHGIRALGSNILGESMKPCLVESFLLVCCRPHL